MSASLATVIVIVALLAVGQWAITAWLIVRLYTACLNKLPPRPRQPSCPAHGGEQR